ncbi:HAD family hydrolase [Actinoplanes sp. DH11]|uniref:HAD family hydrolase n=1 Tax=Actinoplanes sp. DH11 TaxID=2857011 RepID=UPI001E41C1F7|nr:HAD family hydrolase [Actinoplanes sp. DH11]
MGLLLVDLDNTLIDRDAAFRHAVALFLAEHGLPAGDVAWVMEADGGGYTAEDVVAAALADRYGNAVPPAAVGALVDGGGAEHARLTDATETALIAARRAGWRCVVVSNGGTAQQEAKIRGTGLDRLVDGWVISEAVGHKKPAAEIFEHAAALAGLPLAGAWIVGDSPHKDILAAVALGLRSVWVSGGRAWGEHEFRPTHVTADVAGAIDHVVRNG